MENKAEYHLEQPLKIFINSVYAGSNHTREVMVDEYWKFEDLLLETLKNENLKSISIYPYNGEIL